MAGAATSLRSGSIRHPDALRRGHDSAGADVVVLNTPRVPVSASEIRRRVRNGEPIDAFVDPLVSRYIQRNGLYKEGHT